MSITLSYNGTSVEVKPPSFPYEIAVKNGILYSRTPQNVLKGFDHGTSYRECRIGEWILKPADQWALESIIDAAKGNAMELTLSSGSGFYPFGPDMGDSGTFSVFIRAHNPSGRRLSPWRRFTNRLTFTAQHLPSAIVPPGKVEGQLQIGTVGGLRFPQVEIERDRDSGLSIQITRSGRCDTVEYGYRQESAKVRFDLGYANCARVLNYLVTVVRAGEFTVSVPSGTYLFGPQFGAGGLYTVTADISELIIEHVRYNRFRMDLTLHLVRTY